MLLIFTKFALGVDWGGGAFNLVALARRFRRFEVVDALQLADPEEKPAASKVSEFLGKHHLHDAPTIACLPREAVLVRFLELPLEAEPQLAKVVGYQIDALHPFQSGQVVWDCAVVSREANAKKLRVIVVLAERARLDWHQQVLARLGLKINSLSLAAGVLAPLVKSQLPEAALAVSGRPHSVELLAFHHGSLCATQEVSLQPGTNLVERLERELHNARGVLPVPDPATVPLYVCGMIPPEVSEVLSGATALVAPKLFASQPKGFEMRAQLPALAAGYSGLVRKSEPAINLLPPERRWQPQRAALVPAYALGSSALLLTVLLAAHGWIERGLYGRVLDREITRLEAPAAEVRRRSQEVAALDARAALLEGTRVETWRKLEILKALTRLLPQGTWLMSMQVTADSVEITGSSDRAADLVPPLENSPYFSQVEFTSPITRNTQNKEIFRMRMKLRQPAKP